MSKFVAFLREENLSIDSRALKELKVIRSKFNVKVFGLRRKEERVERYTYEESEFPVENLYMNYNSRIGHVAVLSWYYVYAFFRILKNRHNIQFVYAVNMWLGLTALIANKTLNIPYIYDIYDSLPFTRNYPSVIRKIMIWLEKMVVQNADTTIIASEERVEQIPYVNREKLEIIYNSPIINDSIRKSEISEKKRFRIVYIGGLAPARAIPELLEAISMSPDMELIIGGTGALEKVVREYSRTNDNISYIGPQKYETVLQIENDADALTALYDPAIPNHKYASPNKFFEAFALGKPVLMFKDTGMDKWVSSTNAGEVIAEVSASAIKTGLEDIKLQLGDDPELGSRMRNVFDERFSWEKMAIRLNNLLSNVELKNDKN